MLCSVGDGNASPGRASPTSVRREYPPCPSPSAHAIVLRRERVLLVRRARPPSQGGWSVPGGVIELGETVRWDVAGGDPFAFAFRPLAHRWTPPLPDFRAHPELRAPRLAQAAE